MKNRRFFTRLVLVLLAVALPAAAAMAQPGGRGGRGGRDGRGGRGGRGGFSMMQARPVGLSTLLRSEEIREEIEMTEDQYAVLKKSFDEARKKREKEAESRERPDWRNLSEEEMLKLREDFEKRRAEQAKAEKKVVSDELLPMQMTRLEEIAIQVMGIGALADKEIGKKVGVSKEQLEKMTKLVDEKSNEMREKMFEAFRSGGGRDGIREKMMKMRDDIAKVAMDELSAEQRKKFDELKGEKFEVDIFSLMGRGGRGGRGGGFGGGRGDRGGGDRGRQRPQRPAVE